MHAVRPGAAAALSTTMSCETPASELPLQTSVPSSTGEVLDVSRLAAQALAVSAVASLAACGGGHVGTPGPNGAVYDQGLAGSGRFTPQTARDAAPPSRLDAARFLAQASFGPRSLEDIDGLVRQGYVGWLQDQFNAPTLRHVSYLDWQRQRNEKLWAGPDLSYEAIWQQWLAGQDQLRGRVTFALSQIIVISNVADDLPAYALSSWWDMLNRHAFGNYRDLLGAATRHAAMGYFLNMQGSRRENTRTGAHPNENYAREILQLFSIGMVKLQADGNPVMVNGSTVPSYDETVVQGFARAFTGWTTAHAHEFGEFDESREDNWREAMRPVADYHEPGPKTLLDGHVLAAGGSAESDLEAALDNIFAHPNVGPFIGRQLIQRLVTSNPSPAYVGRVAAAFADNGQGVRGDLRAVVSAILLDAEARETAVTSTVPGYGKLREPVLRLAHLLRGLGGKSSSGSNRIHALDQGDLNLGQSPLLAPSVFNFFTPGYKPAGPVASAGLVAPEFQITTETTVVASLNALVKVVESGGIGWGEDRVRLDIDAWQALSADATALADRINWLLCSGRMSDSLRERIVTQVASLSTNNTRQRLRQALILSVLSPDFNVQT